MKTVNSINSTTLNCRKDTRLAERTLSKAERIIAQFLRDKQNMSAVSRTLESALHDNAAGIDWKSRYPSIDYKPLVLFCAKNCLAETYINGNEEILHHLYSQLDSINTIIKDSGIEHDSWTIFYYKVMNQPETIPFREYFNVILEYWPYIKAHTRTYRLLGDLASICSFDESENVKDALEVLINEFAPLWDKEDAKYE